MENCVQNYRTFHHSSVQCVSHPMLIEAQVQDHTAHDSASFQSSPTPRGEGSQAEWPWLRLVLPTNLLPWGW